MCAKTVLMILVDLRDQIKYTVSGSLCYQMRVDHIAIAVNNVQQALTDYQKIFSVDELKIEEVPNEKVRVAMLMLEDTRIELMEPMAPDSPISKFLQERGEGIHHIAITADNIEKDDNNLMPHIINAVKSYTTLGEISSTLRNVFGRYEPKISF